MHTEPEMLHASETTNNNSHLPILETHSSIPVFQGNARSACAPWSGHFQHTAELPHGSSNFSGLPGLPTSAVAPAKAPHIQDAWTNGQSAARQQMTQKEGSWQICQLEKQSAQPAKEITCLLIPSWHCQHRNKWHFFRVSSKHLLSQTNDFFFNCQWKQLKKKPNQT